MILATKQFLNYKIVFKLQNSLYLKAIDIHHPKHYSHTFCQTPGLTLLLSKNHHRLEL